MRLRKSATKHGIDPDDSVTAATTGCRFVVDLDEGDPSRQLRLGFDRSMRVLELVVLIWDDGTEEIIHSMKARKRYLKYLEG